MAAKPEWYFRASQPPGDHPKGAYFTTLAPTTPNLAKRLRIPRTKVAYVFQFVDGGDLRALRGDRGEYVFYSPEDYAVPEQRQTGKGATGL